MPYRSVNRPLLCLSLCLSPALQAHDSTAELEEIVVTGRQQVLTGAARSASEGVIGQADLEIRAMLRPGDVLEAIPGLIVTQHSGSGKSNQMFLRGFNLDHGTDFATWIDGMPVNMRSHGHGQGYTDINFLIPETVERMDYVKGPYHAELGDFSSAGGVRISTFDKLPDNSITLGTGEEGYRRLLAMGGTELGGATLYGALEGQRYDGPWTDIDEDVEKTNALVKLSGGDDRAQWSGTLMHYDNSWNSADQVPKRAIRNGLIDEFGSLDTSLGGTTRRSSLSGQLRQSGEHTATQWQGYLIDYRLNLWSNFTYLLDDPVNGDQFEQTDDRQIIGGSWDHAWTGSADATLHHRAGLELRYDDITVGLHRSRERQRLSTVRRDDVEQGSLGAHYEATWHLAPQWRAIAGIRGDYYWFDVGAEDPANSGSDSDFMASPKASLVYALSPDTEAYLSGGFGFHSNDARGVTMRVDPVTGEPVSPVDPLVRSRGGELGLKTLWLDSWNASLELWYLELDSELLFVGDAGTTEASRPSERWGVEFNNFWALDDIWSLEADIAWTDARFSDRAPEGNELPGALELVVTTGITASFPGGWYGSFRVRHFGAAPLVEDGSEESDGSTLANLVLGWDRDSWRLELEALNLFDSNDHDIDYFFASRLPGEGPDGVEDTHFHVFEPRQLRASVSLRF